MPPIPGGMTLLFFLQFKVFLALLFLDGPLLVGLAFLPIGCQSFAERVPVHPGKRTAQPCGETFRCLPLGGLVLYRVLSTFYDRLDAANPDLPPQQRRMIR